MRYLVRHGCRTLILDASRARLLDSSATGMLVRLRRINGEYRGFLRIAGLGTYHRSVFEVLGVDKVFSLFPTARAAARGAVSPTEAYESAHENAHGHGTIDRTETHSRADRPLLCPTPCRPPSPRRTTSDDQRGR